MYEIEVQQQIKFLNDPNGDNIKLRVLCDDFFLDQPKYEKLRDQFHKTKYHKNKWKWHQIVRLVLEPPENGQYMYDRLLNLILKHNRGIYNPYFILKTEEGAHPVPNPLSDLNRIEILYKKYFELYVDIKNRIHFDFPKNEYIGPSIRGPINWNKTIRNSSTIFPLRFISSIKHKDFQTPENILLILCAEWLFRESSRLLKINFKEPLSDYNRNLLNEISLKTRIILVEFPFQPILNESKRFWNLPYSDPRIKQLEQKSRQRIRQRLVRNSSYTKLLNWIENFRSLNISRVTESTPTTHILDSIENMDVVYEAWIFLEFVEFLYERELLVNFKLGKDPNCTFEYKGLTVTFWYEKTFSLKEGHAWILEHRPDFTAMVDDEILAIFDAKNYSKGSSSSVTDSKNKMLAYMNNLDTSYGALIYPNHPENWDDFKEDERIQKISEHLNSKNSEATSNEITSEAKKLAKLSWSDLPQEYQKLYPAFVPFEHPTSGKKARYHFDQSLCLIRMSPEQSEMAIKLKNDSMQEIFRAIISRIPLTV